MTVWNPLFFWKTWIKWFAAERRFVGWEEVCYNESISGKGWYENDGTI